MRNDRSTFESEGLVGGLTAVEGLWVVDEPETEGWILGFDCGWTEPEVDRGGLLLLDANVASGNQEAVQVNAALTICNTIQIFS